MGRPPSLAWGAVRGTQDSWRRRRLRRAACRDRIGVFVSSFSGESRIPKRGRIKDSIPGSFPGSEKPAVRGTGRAGLPSPRGAGAARRAAEKAPNPGEPTTSSRPPSLRPDPLLGGRSSPAKRKRGLRQQPEHCFPCSAAAPRRVPTWLEPVGELGPRRAFVSFSSPAFDPQVYGALKGTQPTPLRFSDFWGKNAWTPRSSSRIWPASLRTSGATAVIRNRRVLNSRDWAWGVRGRSFQKAFWSLVCGSVLTFPPAHPLSSVEVK